MATERQITRRGLLAAGIATGTVGAAASVASLSGGALLAGCGLGGNCDTWSEADEPKPPPQADGEIVLATLADIPVGRGVTARGRDDEPIIVTRTTETTAVAFSAKCPHKGCLVKPDGERLRCPPHDARFNPATGTPQAGPPKRPLRRVEVTVVDGRVVLAT